MQKVRRMETHGRFENEQVGEMQLRAVQIERSFVLLISVRVAHRGSSFSAPGYLIVRRWFDAG